MAPGTRPTYKLNANDIIAWEEMDQDNNIALNDPWSIEVTHGQESNGNVLEGFEDSFVVEVLNAATSESSAEESSLSGYEQNKEYLNYLESKLRRIEHKNRNPQKLSAGDVLNSLRDIKEKQMEWSFKQGISSSEDDILDSDGSHSSGSGNAFTNELRRKMFPEQQALNDTELLRLLDHDVIEKVSRQPDT